MSKGLAITLAIAIGVAIGGFGTLRVSHTTAQNMPPITITGLTTSTTSAGLAPASTPTGVTGTMVQKSIQELSRLTNVEWKKMLTPAQYAVLRENGTEVPFTSSLLHETRKGTFVTADCGEPVFRSEQKFDSGTGWPSFYAPLASSSIVIKKDTSLGMVREEVETPICHSHIGHLFHDAPQTPTGDRFCINGVALKFIPDAGQ